MSTPSELRDLVAKIEGQRKRREYFQMGSAIVAGAFFLGVIAFTLPQLAAKQQVAEAPPVEGFPVATAYDDVVISAKAAIVYDLVEGKVLYEKNAQAQLPLASLTKLLTVYAGANALGAGSRVTVSANAIMTEGESGFMPNEEFAFSDLAKAALVGSSNDAAAAIAENAEQRRAVSTEYLFRNAAAAAGLASTYAVNGTGLDVNGQLSGGYGSAEDIALLSGALLERVRDIALASTKPTLTVESLSGNTYTFKNTNPDVERIPGLMLSKTGYTDLAGGNLAVIFDASINHPIAVVVLGSSVENRFTDVDRLVQATFSTFIR